MKDNEGPPRAVFIGWTDCQGFMPNFPLYNIHGDHPLCHGTVSEKTLKKLGIEVPQTPTFEEWKKDKGGNR